MTVETTQAKVIAPGNGTATSFSFSPVVINESGDLSVVKTDANGNDTTLTEDVHYTVVVASYPGTGSITYPISGAKLADGEQLTMKRVVALTQSTDLENQGGYFADVQETALDRACMIDIQQQEEIDRSLKFPVSDASEAVELPGAAQRAGMALVFDADGQPTAGALPDIAVAAPWATVVQNATLAGGLTAAGFSAYAQTLLSVTSVAELQTTAGLGTASLKDTGTSGTKVPLLDGVNTWSGGQTFSGGVQHGTPTGGNKGAGSVNAQTVYVGGVKGAPCSYALLQDQQAAGSNSRAMTSSAWNTITLNTKVSDADAFVTLAANQFTLAAGTYRVRALHKGGNAAASACYYQPRIRNVTDGTTVALGPQSFCQTNAGSNVELDAVFTLAATKTLEFQCWASTSTSTGLTNNTGELAVWSQVVIERVG